MTPEQAKMLEELKSLPVKEDTEVDELEQLKALVEEVESEQQVVEEEEVVPVQEQLRNDILSLFRQRKDAPSDAEIDTWKSKYGGNGVRLFALDEDNIYLYAYLNLDQWEQIQSIMQKLAGTPKADQAEKLLREHVIKSAVLWPKDVGSQLRKRAGLTDVLYQLIMINSYFLTPQAAMNMTVQL